jgi:pimeloyl-ACP methyl ester carboxylesterase
VKTKANGIEIHYEISGAGPCLALIHGFADNLNFWYEQVPEFSRRYRTLTYDVRGFGRTERVDGPYAIDVFAEDLHELLNALGIDATCLLGFSMGGRIALEFALTHPEMTTGLILANSGVETSPRPEMEKHRRIMRSVLAEGNLETLSTMLTKGSFSPGFSSRDPETFRSCKAIRMQNDPSDYLAIMEAVDRALDAPVDLSRLELPVLLIAGEHDALMGRSIAERMKEAIADAELKVLPTGHASALEAPEEFNRVVLDFMARLPEVGRL